MSTAITGASTPEHSSFAQPIAGKGMSRRSILASATVQTGSDAKGAPYVPSLADDLSGISQMADAVQGLWDNNRECISAVTNGDPESGLYGPVSGLDWALVMAVSAALAKAEKRGAAA